MSKSIKLLWLCGVPFEVEQNALHGKKVGAIASWSWVMAHLPPPEGVELHIACPAKSIKADMIVEYNGATFHLFPYRRGAVYSFYRFWMPGFRRVFKTVSPDWVHGWGVEAGYGMAATALDPQKSSIEIQGILADYFKYIRKSIPLWFGLVSERLTLHRGKRFIAESNYSAAEAQKYTSGEVRVVSQPLRDNFLQAPVGKGSRNQMVFLGTLEDRKGIKDAVRAFAAADVQGWTLCCIGQGTPEYMQEVQELIDVLGVTDQVSLCGTLPSVEVTEKLMESPIFLLPTYMDTGPNALKEALALGLWPVCYDNSGPGEFIRRYGVGSLAKTGDVDHLSVVLKRAVLAKPWENVERREECVKRVRYDLSREKAWEELLKCFSEDYCDDSI